MQGSEAFRAVLAIARSAGFVRLGLSTADVELQPGCRCAGIDRKTSGSDMLANGRNRTALVIAVVFRALGGRSCDRRSLMRADQSLLVAVAVTAG